MPGVPVLLLIGRFNRIAVKHTDLLDPRDEDFPIRALTLYRGEQGMRKEIVRIVAPDNLVIRAFYSDAIPWGTREFEVDSDLEQRTREFFVSSRFLAMLSMVPEFSFLEHLHSVTCIGDIEWRPRVSRGAS